MGQGEGLNIRRGAAHLALEATAEGGQIGSGSQTKPNTMLFDEIRLPANLHMAWQRVRQNKGSAGIDGITVDDYPKWAQAHWQNVKRGLEQGYYCPQPVKRVEIPKPNGGIRLLGIPTVNDRLIQQAIVQRLQPVIDLIFSAHSYGFRPYRSAHQAIKAVQPYQSETPLRRGYRPVEILRPG